MYAKGYKRKTKIFYFCNQIVVVFSGEKAYNPKCKEVKDRPKNQKGDKTWLRLSTKETAQFTSATP